MYGVVTRHEAELDWPAFDVGCYEVKDVAGNASEPSADATNTLSAFADNAAAREDPEIVPVSADGERATPERPYFDWSFVCPSHDAYRAGLLEMVEDCAAAAPDLRLDDVGFPRAEYCHCERCDAAFAASDRDDRADWRADVVTEFVRDVRDRVPGDLSLAVHPDPYPGHLRRRAGIDLERVLPLIDRLVVPLYDTVYGTTYWLESLASGFETRLDRGAFDGRLAVELYAVDVDLDALVGAAEVAEAYADDVFFGYDSSNATAALRRMRADAEEGVTHRPDGTE
ncbi:MAG: hypothetical protein ABEJ43_00530 [Haloferacaceae archaeon]